MREDAAPRWALVLEASLRGLQAPGSGGSQSLDRFVDLEARAEGFRQVVPLMLRLPLAGPTPLWVAAIGELWGST